MYNKKNHLRIFMFHGVGQRNNEDHYGLTVEPLLFKSQMQMLVNSNYNFVKLSKKCLDEAAELPRNYLAITFDDGYKNNLIAAEILINMKIPFSVYCIANKVNTNDYLSANDIQDLINTEYCTIGCHGLTHSKLGLMNHSEQEFELKKSKEILEDYSGTPITTMSLPHGSLNASTKKIALEVGFDLIATSRPGLNNLNCIDGFHLKRTEIRSHDNLKTFASKLNASDDWRSIVYLLRSLTSVILPSQWMRYSE